MRIEKLSKNKYLVHSDSGEVYQVQLSGESKKIISCSCRGFVFRRKCKHVDEILKISGDEGISVKVIPDDLYAYIRPYKQSLITLLRG